jgi:hypothetical protein
MAKKDEEKAKLQGNGNNQVQGFVFGINLKGSEAVVMEGIKAFTHAMTKSGVVLTPPVVRPSLSAGAPAPAATTSTVDTEEIPQPEVTDAVVEDEDEEIQDDAVTEEPGNSGPKRTYTFKAPKFLHELDMTKASKPLVDFMAEKGNPTELMDRYIAIAVWLKDHMQTEEFTINHIWTAYSLLGWKTQFPENHSQTLRDLKSKKNYLTKEKGAGYKVSWPGEQYVTKMGA